MKRLFASGLLAMAALLPAPFATAQVLNEEPAQPAYHGLPFGYLAERLTRDKRPHVCLGCDALLPYLQGLNRRWWSSASWRNFLLPRGLWNDRAQNHERLNDDYHQDLLLSLFKSSPRPPVQRFMATQTVRPAPWDWPVALSTIPDSPQSWMACADANSGDKRKPIARANATRVSGGARLQDIECRMEMASGGAALLRVPLTSGDMPDRVFLSARAVGKPDSNGRTTPVGNLHVIAMTAADRGAGSRDIRELEGLDFYPEAVKPVIAIDSTDAQRGLSDILFLVRYPAFHTPDLSARNGRIPYRGLMDVALDVEAYFD